MRKEARVACNPISSLYALKGTETSGTEEPKTGERRKANRSRGTTLTTASNEVEKANESQLPSKPAFQPKPCLYCKSTDHHISRCPSFASKSLDDRKKFVQEDRLCFGCLKNGHLSKDCRRRHTCNKCKGRHPTMLHYDTTESKSSNQKEVKSPKREEIVTAVSCGVHLENARGTSMIVPVWVSSAETPSKEVLTYALLDTQSDSTFILDNTTRSISAHCEPVRLKLSTMTSASSMIDCSAVTNILVRGMSSSNRIQIPRSYTRDFIPVDKSHNPTADTARRWSHLYSIIHEIAPLQNCGVGMLIGYKCSQALAPRQTIVGSDEEPYAVKTDLGWTIVGYDEQSTNSRITSVCHRVSVKEAPCISPLNVISILEADFSEKHHAEKTISQ